MSTESPAHLRPKLQRPLSENMGTKKNLEEDGPSIDSVQHSAISSGATPQRKKRPLSLPQQQQQKNPANNSFVNVRQLHQQSHGFSEDSDTGSLNFSNREGTLMDMSMTSQFSEDLTASIMTQHSRVGMAVDRKESYKAQRRSYAREKKRVEKELMSTFRDQSIIVLADWLKVRGTLKSWTKLWCVLKPGLLLIYKSQKTKSSHWIGTIILSTCELIERPSKKDGFCFKLFHPMDQSIWAARGPEGEALGAVTAPLPTSHLIFRAPNNAAGKCWMDALELALRCSSLLLRSMSNNSSGNASGVDGPGGASKSGCESGSAGGPGNSGGQGTNKIDVSALVVEAARSIEKDQHRNQKLNESDIESHFRSELDGEGGNTSSGEHQGQSDPRRASERSGDAGDIDETGDTQTWPRQKRQQQRRNNQTQSGGDSDYSEDTPYSMAEDDNEYDEEEEDAGEEKDEVSSSSQISMTKYVPDPNQETFGSSTDQTEEFSEENKSIVWFLVKQVRPGMDLSRVVLPTFILEPRSFLDKLTDYHYHADLLADAIKLESPFERMKSIVKWYLSGFYKKPKGLKKPYNPILGETFRCYWEHPNGSKTFYIAEQVSHHPPISSFYVTNRQEGFTISSTIVAKSKFYGNSISALLDGTAVLNFLPRGEEYHLTMPYAHCKGILMGTMTMELGGKVTIECPKTGYSTEMEFKLRPFLGGGEFTNAVSGKIRLGKEVLSTIDGKWDDCVKIKDKKAGSDEILWKVSPEVIESRLKRFTVPMDDQGDFESQHLWRKVSHAIDKEDQTAATEEKFVLEEEQRAGARERRATGREWVPKYFELDPAKESYEYKHGDLRPWDPMNDLYQYESNYVICTKTKHKTPMIRTQSIISVTEKVYGSKEGMIERSSSKVRRRRNTKEKLKMLPHSNTAASSTEGGEGADSTIPEESEDNGKSKTDSAANGGAGGAAGTGGGANVRRANLSAVSGNLSKGIIVKCVEEAVAPIRDQQSNLNDRLIGIQRTLEVMKFQQKERDSASNINRDMVLLVVLVVMIQAVLTWVLTHKAQQGLLFGGDTGSGGPGAPTN